MDVNPIRILLGCIVLLFSFTFSLRAQETFSDTFGSVSYANNDGTLNFSADWVENNETTDPGAGRIQINSNQLRFSNLDGRFITRSLDLSSATSVTLTLDYNASSRGNESLLVRLWDTGTSSYQTIATINTSSSGSISYTLTANQISSLSSIRLQGGDSFWSSGETIFVDNIVFTATLGPVISIGDITVNEADGTATFTATHVGQDASGPFIVTYQTVDGTATSGTDYTAISGGTLSFTGTVGDTELIVVTLTDDNDFEGSETFSIQLTGSTDPAVGITDIATGTIEDNEPLLGNTPLALFREFDGYLDYTSTAGTLRTQPDSVDPCAITTSSSNTLTSSIPAGATIEGAFLYWAHSGTNLDSEVTFEGTTVTADLAYTTTSFGLTFYGLVSDVTSLVSSIPDPSTNVFDFSGLNIDNTGSYCSTTVVLGGWSLIIFYSHPSLPAATINLYQGFDGNQYSSSNFTLSGFYAIGSVGAKTTSLSWEGDQNRTGSESLQFSTPLSGTNNLAGDGDNNGTTVNNPFNSTVYDNTTAPVVNNTGNYGVDLDTYDVSSYILPGETTATTQVNVGIDYVIMNAVVLKVPSNLITGRVFEDLSYGGGVGRDFASSAGVGLPDATVELYDAGGSLVDTEITDANGVYVFAGMIDGTYSVRVANETVRSSRDGGSICSICLPVQTFKTDYAASTITPDTNQVGGADPGATDPGAGILTGAQSVSFVSIVSEGAAGVDFGFNFNTIVNSNDSGQGSLDQFIINANNLEETGLDIDANALFDPPAGADISVFMIPPSGDPLGRTADPGFTGTYFDISLPGSLEELSSGNTIIDARTQIAYSGNTNVGNVGVSGTTVGVSATVLPTYELPEIQIYTTSGPAFINSGSTNEIRYLSVSANNDSGIRMDSGELGVSGCLLGVGADGSNSGSIETAVEVNGGSGTLEGNFIATNALQGVWIRNTSSLVMQSNHITGNGVANCGYNVLIENGTGIIIQENLIENAEAAGLEAVGIPGSLQLVANSITGSGQDPACNSGVGGVGVRLGGSNSTIAQNIVFANGNAGLILNDPSGNGNLISQNSFYANGTTADALGIDLDASNGFGDGVSLNDSGDLDSGPNGLHNFPIIVSTYISGGDLVIKGWARPGSTLEIFLTDINEGTAVEGDNQLGTNSDYGEGQVFLASVVEGSASDLDTGSSNYTDTDGNADITEKYEFRISIPVGIDLGDRITATSTLSNSTSEFSPLSTIRVQKIITNRRITYRVNPN